MSARSDGGSGYRMFAFILHSLHQMSFSKISRLFIKNVQYMRFKLPKKTYATSELICSFKMVPTIVRCVQNRSLMLIQPGAIDK